MAAASVFPPFAMEAGGKERAIFALTIVLAIFGVGMLSIAPVDIIRCTPERDCRIERSVAGVHFVGAEELKHVTSVSIEKRTEFYKNDQKATTA